MSDFMHIFRNRWPLKEAYTIFSFTCHRRPIMMPVHNSCIRVFSPRGGWLAFLALFRPWAFSHLFSVGWDGSRSRTPISK